MSGRLIVVSNRIPTEAQPSGGLVVALHECLSAQGGIWIGSSGDPVDTRREGLHEIGERGAPYRRLVFDLDHRDHETFYLGFANSVLWPLFHRRADLIDIQQGQFDGYMDVNRRLAGYLADIVEPDDVLWIHDYHFLPLGEELRRRGLRQRIGFFLHIPFPTTSDVPALGSTSALMDWVAAYDVFGLQTEADVRRCRLLFETEGEGAARGGTIVHKGRTVRPDAFPIGIDPADFRRAALASTAGDNLALGPNQKLVIGVDRLDYSKGLVHRFDAFGTYLANRKPDVPRATLLQIAPPSREAVEAYREIREALEMAAGSINGEHAELDWTPIRYIHRPVPRAELAGVMRRADVALVTPLADGMNLVAKEFVAAQDPEDPGVLILSRFAGAAEQMPEALIINPYDAEETASAIARALDMGLDERQRRWSALKKSVTAQDINWWTQSFLDALREPVAEQA